MTTSIERHTIDIQEVHFMAQINVRIDDALKQQADRLFEELGLNMSTAVNMFVRQAVRDGGIPFEITTKTDLFFSKENQEEIERRVSMIEAGEAKMVVKTMEELEAMENG